MPFPDEHLGQRVTVVAYRETWAREGARLVDRLRLLLPDAASVQHIGSTSVPGLAAKDCLDVMVQVADLDDTAVSAWLERHGYRRRPEAWNQEETSFGVRQRKLVFAPPVGERASNIHIREKGGLNVRYALLFRDYLTADAEAADAWGRFKLRLAQTASDLMDYGQIKAPAEEILMTAALRWAEEHEWNVGTAAPDP